LYGRIRVRIPRFWIYWSRRNGICNLGEKLTYEHKVIQLSKQNSHSVFIFNRCAPISNHVEDKVAPCCVDVAEVVAHVVEKYFRVFPASDVVIESAKLFKSAIIAAF